MIEPTVALLGRRDEPTDALEQYCVHLSAALRMHDFAMEVVRMRWKESGWPAARHDLEQKARNWRGRWVLLQYTALSWSERGFPLQVPRVIKILRDAGARIGVVYHDVEPYSGRRAVDHLRRFVQQRVFNEALRRSDQAILTVPAERLSWMAAGTKKAVFIPVGANFSRHPSVKGACNIPQNETPTVAVFGVTGGIAGQQEVLQITAAMRLATEQLGKLRLLVFGRQADLAEASLREKLCDLPITLSVAGVLPENDIERLLSSADVLLFVRGPISSRRGSAIAGIACGLPIIAFSGSETAEPITDAGVVLVAAENKAMLGQALVRVLSDREYHGKLAERSRTAYINHFSWEAIARRYASVLRAPVGADNP